MNQNDGYQDPEWISAPDVDTSTPVNFSIGAGGSGMLYPIYGSADSGVAIDTNGSACFYSAMCVGGGFQGPLAGELGIVGRK